MSIKNPNYGHQELIGAIEEISRVHPAEFHSGITISQTGYNEDEPEFVVRFVHFPEIVYTLLYSASTPGGIYIGDSQGEIL